MIPDLMWPKPPPSSSFIQESILKAYLKKQSALKISFFDQYELESYIDMAAAPSQSALTADPMVDANVLLVEDSSTQVKIIMKMLKKASLVMGERWSFTIAYDAEEAIAIVDSACFKFDLTFVDQNLSPNGLSGDKLISLLRRSKSMMDAIIIMCTSNAPKNCIRGTRSGADAVWGKPIPSVDEIVSRLKRFKYKRSDESFWKQLPKQKKVDMLLQGHIRSSLMTRYDIASIQPLSELIHVLCIGKNSLDTSNLTSVFSPLGKYLFQNWHIHSASTENALRLTKTSVILFNIVIFSVEDSNFEACLLSLIRMREHVSTENSILICILSSVLTLANRGYSLISHGADNIWLEPLPAVGDLCKRFSRFKYFRHTGT